MTVHYASYNRLLRTALWTIDHWLTWHHGRRPTAPASVPSADRILICNQGHLGDAILATAVIPPLRAAFPQAEFGFLVNPVSRPLLEGDPQIRWIHSIEHWHLIRDDVSLPDRIRRHKASHRGALRDIRGVGYQLAIDLHPYFPNSIPLLKRSDIDCLVGWDSAGFGRWLDITASDDGRPTNVMDRHASILRLLGISCDGNSLRPHLHISDEAIASWRLKSQARGIGDAYIAVHVGAHVERRRWPASHWREVVAEFQRRGHQVVLLGHGAAESALAREIVRECPQAIDLSGQLAWGELLAAIASSSVVLSHDSAAAHLAAAFERPRICIATGIHDLRVWLREGERSVVLSRPVACAPCGRVGGCTTMACLRGVAGDAVVEATMALIAAPAVRSTAGAASR